jgi:hypothetical protein
LHLHIFLIKNKLYFMFKVKFILVLASCYVTILLAVFLFIQILQLWRAPYSGKVSGFVKAVKPPPPEDEGKKPGSGSIVTVRFTDFDGKEKIEEFTSFNSGGHTEVYGKKPGDRVELEMTVNYRVPGTVKKFDWRNFGMMHLLLGGILFILGFIFFLL